MSDLTKDYRENSEELKNMIRNKYELVMNAKQ